MKTKYIISLILGLAAFFFVIGNNLFAQTCMFPLPGNFCPAINTDIVTGVTPALNPINNTGNDAIDILYVNVWGPDGTAHNGELGWYEPGSGFNGYITLAGSGGNPLTDPDVIVFHDPPSVPEPMIVVVYLDAGQVFYDVYCYIIGTGPTAVLTHQALSSSGFGICSSPNVDVSRLGPVLYIGHVVFTWAQVGVIRTSAINLNVTCGGLLTPLYTPPRVIYNQTGNGIVATASDLTINMNQNPFQGEVSYVFRTIGTNQNLQVKQFQLIDIINNTGTFNGNYALYSPALALLDFLGPPRIASPPLSGGAYGAFDFEVVVEHSNTALGAQIEGFNLAFNGVPVGPTLLNNNLQSCGINESPVVAYVNDYIMVAWTFDDPLGPNPCNYLNQDFEVIAVRLCNASCGTPGVRVDIWFSIVNYLQEWDQHVPSISRVANSSSGLTFYTFYNDLNTPAPDIKYKASHFTNIDLKNGDLENYLPPLEASLSLPCELSELKIYPNPLNNDTGIELCISDADPGIELLLFNIDGQLIIRKNISDLPGGSHTISWINEMVENEELTAGMYLLKFVTANNTYFYKVFKN